MATTGDAAPRRLRADAERNRERLVAAAGELFARKGLSVGLDEIARHAGVGVGTAYRRFPDKEVLIDALFEARIGELVALGERSLADADAWSGLVTFLTGMLERQDADHGLRELVLGSPHGAARVEQARERLGPVLVELVDRARRAGALRDDVVPADLVFVQLMVGAVARSEVPERRALWPRYLALLLDGLRARGAAPLPGDPDAVRAAALSRTGSAP